MERSTSIRARIAREQQRGADPDLIASLRRDYYASRAREYITQWLAGDPAPTTAQRTEVASLLRGGTADVA